MASSILEIDNIICASQLSGQPVTDHVLWTDNKLYPLAAVDHWIMPKRIFVIQWYWLMLQGRLGIACMDLEKWNAQLQMFNRHIAHTQDVHHLNLMETIHVYVKKRYKSTNWEEQYRMFHLALEGWNPC